MDCRFSNPAQNNFGLFYVKSILFHVYKPFVVAVYLGTTKPHNVNEYLATFIKEVNTLLSEGIIIDGKMLSVHIKCFICDRPARSYIKCIKGHNGYNSCERCIITGKRHNNTMVFLETNCTERTVSFKNQTDINHHNDTSPLVDILNLDMVNDFVLDFMHLCCLGVTKRM